MKKQFTPADVEATLQLKSWWAALAILPLARRLILSLCNHTEVTPNQITALAFFIRLVAALCFLEATPQSLIAGALLFESAYLLDCVDGSIARLKNLGSPIGAFFDHATDTLSVSLAMIALAAGQGILLTPVVLSTIYLYLFIHFLTFVFNTIWARERLLLGETQRSTVLTSDVYSPDQAGFFARLHNGIKRYRAVFERNRFKAFFSPPDLEALLLFIAPIAGLVEQGFRITLAGLVLLLAYKTFSYLFVLKTSATIRGS